MLEVLIGCVRIPNTLYNKIDKTSGNIVVIFSLGYNMHTMLTLCLRIRLLIPVTSLTRDRILISTIPDLEGTLDTMPVTFAKMGLPVYLVFRVALAFA